MDEHRKEQLEALKVMEEFNGRLVKNMKIIVRELSGQRLDDTDNFLKAIIDAINWEIQVVNGTMDVLNEGKERVNKENFNEAVKSLSNAIVSKDDSKMAAEFTNIIPKFEELGEAAGEVLAKNESQA